MTRFTRRSVLAGAVGLGAIGATGTGLGLLGRRPYTHYTYAQTVGDTNDAVLRVAWYETYNGQVEETQRGVDSDANATLDPAVEPLYVEDAPGPIVDLTGVMPGDSGSLVIGLEAVEEAARVWFRPTLDATDENGINEPEAKAGDTTAAQGELQDRVSVRIWRDEGVLDSGFGRCDGRYTSGERQFTDGQVPLAEVDGLLPDGVELVDCLEPGANYCVGLTWDLPAETGNEIQTDSVDFSLQFVGIPCSETCNPFTGDCEEVAAE
jgi:hypothetical protein